MSTTLTSKQINFVEHYLTDRNGTQAAIRAGYSARSAAEIAYELLRKPHISDMVQSRTRQLAEDLAISRRQAIRELIEAAEYAKVSGNAMVAIFAWREVSLLLGLYPPPHQVSYSADRLSDVTSLPKEALVELAGNIEAIA